MCNLVAMGPVVSEEKSFEIVDRRQTVDGACLYYKLPLEPSAQVS